MAKAPTKKSDSSANLGFEAKLWLTADKLRNNMDAAEYKHVVLGLIFLKYISDTSGRQRVPTECFNSFLLAVPTPEIAHRFNEITAPLMAKIKANSRESRTLATLRDTLLPKLLSGEISLSNAEKEVAA
jgi:hypothetical protein